MKFLFFTDTHVTAKAPSSREDDIKDSIYNKFLDVGKIIEDEAVDVVLHGGDFFHTPDVSNDFSGKITKILRSYKKPIYVTPGSHDIYGYNISTLGNTKLGLLESAGVVEILDRNKGSVMLSDGNLNINLEGQEYYGEIDENMLEDYRINNVPADFNILVIHSMLLENPFFQNAKHTLIRNVVTSADMVLAGHYHPGFTETKIGNTHFFNPGSVTRTESSIGAQNAVPRVIVFEITKDEHDVVHMDWKYVNLPSAKPSSQIFSQAALSNKAVKKSLDEFKDKLANSQISGISLMDLLNEYLNANPKDLEYIDYAKKKLLEVTGEEQDDEFEPSNKHVSISKVEIINFQSNKNKTVDFTNGLNVIVGESNAGKSAILRAIIWALYDTPNGNDFITTGARSATVRVHLSNGHIIERKRSNSSSGTLKLIYPDGTEKEFKGFSRKLPKEIMNAHQMPSVVVNGESYRVNVASQHDPQFLIGYGSSERSSLIGSLVDAHKADLIKKELTSEKRKLTSEKGILESLRNQKALELDKFANLDTMKKNIIVLSRAIVELDSKEDTYNRLKNAKSLYDKSSTECDIIEQKLNDILHVDMSLILQYKNELMRYQTLSIYNSSYKESVNKLKSVEQELSRLSYVEEAKELVSKLKLELANMESLTSAKNKYTLSNNVVIDSKQDEIDEKKLIKSQLEDKVNELEKLVSLKTKLDKSNRTIENLDKRARTLGDIIESKLSKKDRLIEELKSHKSVCRYCGSEVDIDKFLKQ